MIVSATSAVTARNRCKSILLQQAVRSSKLSLSSSSSSSLSLLNDNKRWFSSTNAMSSSSSFENVGVIGLGLMGHGIAQVAAQSGVHKSIIAYEKEQKFLDSGKTRIEKSIQKLISKEKLTKEQGEQVLSTITYTTNINDLSETDFIIEAVIENMDLKRELYTELGQICNEKTIFASNTSSLSISEMAQYCPNRLDKFIGVHFFNPVQIMKLVEIIKTTDTSKDVYDKVYKWVQDIKKVPVTCNDTPGFIVNRLLVPSLIQAMLLYERNDASIADIDISMQLGCGHPMGPLHLSDYIGLDTCLYIIQGWVDKYPNEPAFIIPKVLHDMVNSGHLGRKTGQGFYYWDGDKRGNPIK